MAHFKDVFSTTLKVLPALIIISAVIGVGGLILGGLGSVVIPTGSVTTEPAAYRTAETDTADAFRTTMPRRTWDIGIARAVRKHCFAEGMNKEEVVQSLGKPTTKEDHAYSGSSWTWQLPPSKCLKYDGDKCMEQEERHKTIEFTAKGRVYLQGSSCQTLDDDYVYFDSRELFVTTERRRLRALPPPNAPPIESEN